MNKQQKEGKMNNTENLINTECECSMDYELAYHDAMRQVDRLVEENISLRNVIKELSKVI